MLTISLSSLALLVALLAAGRVFFWSPPTDAPARPEFDDGELWKGLETLEQRIEALRADYGDWQGDINLAVAEGIKHVERAENRIKATVRRAREELADGGIRSPGLEAENRDLFGGDEDGGGARAVPAVRPDLDVHNDDLSAFPGTWLPEHLQALRG